MPTSLYSDDLVETNLGADGMYAEVNEMQRMKAVSETTLPPPVDAHPPSYLEVVRDATPKDYNNEELYQSMEKIYYVVSLPAQHNVMKQKFADSRTKEQPPTPSPHIRKINTVDNRMAFKEEVGTRVCAWGSSMPLLYMW